MLPLLLKIVISIFRPNKIESQFQYQLRKLILLTMFLQNYFQYQNLYYLGFASLYFPREGEPIGNIAKWTDKQLLIIVLIISHSSIKILEPQSSECSVLLYTEVRRTAARPPPGMEAVCFSHMLYFSLCTSTVYVYFLKQVNINNAFP